MTDPQPELLVVLDPAGASRALERLRRVAPVTQVLEPRLALVRADAGALEEIASVEGVSSVHADATAGVPLGALVTEGERLFVAAWSARGAKDRVGDGLPWDAPGFSPPDPPNEGPT